MNLNRTILIATILLAATSLGWGLSVDESRSGNKKHARETKEGNPPRVKPWEMITLKPYASGFVLPTDMTHAGDGSGRTFVVEKTGRVRVVRSGKVLPIPFLDITDRVRSRESERGLLGIAFHPGYGENGRFFANYTDRKGNTIVAEYRAEGGSDRADEKSERILLQIAQPASNHNGGQLAFGLDGYLYIGTGDGGRGGDPWGNAQNRAVLLGKMLRIDVNGEHPYAVPPGNPFTEKGVGLPEIWAMGLRNPWRFSFDRATGDIYIADVGQDRWEEINVHMAGDPGGVNFGWDLYEGFHPHETQTVSDTITLKVPVLEYGHDVGCSVTGGYVYRGKRYPSLSGTYFFSDFCSGKIWGLRKEADGWEWAEFLDTELKVSSFGQDEEGEIYLLDHGSGTVYRLTLAER